MDVNKKQILVVDDTAFMVTVISTALSDAGYGVVCAKSGEEALELLKGQKPDLLLLDGVMTGMSGYDVLTVLRNDFRFNLMPIIMLTGQSDDEEKFKSLEMGADDYIVKPFNNRELLARVHNTLLRLERSRGANPLTGLRGNNDIEMEIANRLHNDVAFSVLYFDLNSFKPYNDVYGFANGDLAIKMTANVITEAVSSLGAPQDFIGHIGGDDFVVITEPALAVPIAENIIRAFDKRVLALYTPDDVANGYITSLDRFGKVMQFGILGISIAIVNASEHNISSTLHLAEIAADLKKQAKNIADGRSAYVC